MKWKKMNDKTPKLSFVPPEQSNVTKLVDPEWVQDAEDFLSEVKNNTITHAAIIYRTREGQTVFRRWGENHRTFLMGLMIKGAIRLGLKDDWEDGGPEDDL